MAQPDTTSDATLKAIGVSTGELVPAFSPGRNRYAVYVGHTVDVMQIDATVNAPGATVTVADKPAATPVPLNVGMNVCPVLVTAADGKTVQTYTLKVVRAQPTVNWTQVVEHAPWPARDSAGEVVFDDAMWLLGGYIPKVIGDVWRSADGTTWDHVGEVPSEAGVNIPVEFVFNGRMWVTTNKGELFASKDGKQWDLVNATPPWAGRYAAGGVVFDGKMWAMGGFRNHTLFNDVWCSTDGVDWTCVTEHAAWSGRQLFGNVVAMDGKMWVIGGGITQYEPFKGYRDVWCSTDGKSWQRVTGEAPWPGRIWSTCAVYRNRIFLLGGFRAQPAWENRDDVWYSADGKTWNQLKTETMWPARHELSAYVFKDKLWVVAGNSWPLNNDVWSLDIPGLAFLSQPVIEEYVTAMYTYHAHADFNASGQPVQYRLVEAPSWLSVDADTGVVSGAPEQAGQFPVVLEAFDKTGETARQSWTIIAEPL